ncbi:MULTISPECIES: radical SAM protein [Streptacidiphilus]|uniref:Radical SAM protein n=1 Tax=Streptacidiphilus cavernicola TaxID=3342716 RepID=A0ABV6UGR5_9ACTN|nr:radical SAM protein [Streptacidiphilus jeojiense]
MQLPAFVDLRPIGRCNLSCPFCFGPRHEVPSMPREDALRVAASLREAGVEGVVISGGEPTLLPYLPDLAAELRRAGPGRPAPRVVLSTNGLAPARVLEKVLPHLSWIALPIESSLVSEHRDLRTGVRGHRDRVVTLLRNIRINFPHVQVKLGTVITKLNAIGAPGVLDLLDDDQLPDVWKIYQMSPTNYGADNQDWLSLPDQEFKEVVARCEQAADSRGVPLRVYWNSARAGSYLFVDPDCSTVVIDESGERRIGNFFDLIERTGPTPVASIIPTRNAENFTTTYPSRRDSGD